MSPRPERPARAPRARVAALAAAALPLAACGRDPGPVVEIADRRVATHVVHEVLVGATAEERFGAPRTQAPAAPAVEDLFVWETPVTWERVAARSRFRALDFVVGGDPRAEATVSILPAEGGRILDNLDRWREQLGLPPLDPAEVVGLPRHELLGASVPYLVADGVYEGLVGGDPIPDARLLGLIYAHPEFSLYVKLTAPRAVAIAEEPAFLEFAASLRFASQAQAEHDHDGDGLADHGPEAHGEEAPAADPGAPSPPAGGVAPEHRVAWTAPEGWREEAAGQFLLAAFGVGEGSRATVSRARGTLEDNLVRWYGQLGVEPPADPVAAAMRLQVLGEGASLVEIQGDFAGMGAPPIDDALLIGLVVPLGEDSLFVKLLGPAPEVRLERARFLQFVGALRWEERP